MSRTISENTKRYNELRRVIASITHAFASPFIYHLYEKHGYTYEQVGKIVNLSRQRIEVMFPKGGDKS